MRRRRTRTSCCPRAIKGGGKQRTLPLTLFFASEFLHCLVKHGFLLRLTPGTLEAPKPQRAINYHARSETQTRSNTTQNSSSAPQHGLSSQKTDGKGGQHGGEPQPRPRPARQHAGRGGYVRRRIPEHGAHRMARCLGSSVLGWRSSSKPHEAVVKGVGCRGPHHPKASMKSSTTSTLAGELVNCSV